MNATEQELERAKAQARTQIDCIVDMVRALNEAAENGQVEYEGETVDADGMYQRIYEDALSVQVRSDWHTPGESGDDAEYTILLCTGGPAVRIVGDLGSYGEPSSATVQYQDWFTPWVDYVDADADEESALLQYAQTLLPV